MRNHVKTARALKGIIPSLLTPMKNDGAVDEESLRSLVNFDIEKKVDALSTTMVAGEFYKLLDDERKRIVEVVIDETDGRIPVLVGTSHSGTEPAIELSRHAADAGADAIIVMPPYFDKHESEPYLFEHFSRIASKVDLPLMIQDAEEETGMSVPVELYPRLLKEHSNIFLVKVETLEPLKRIREIKALMNEDMVIFGARTLLEELEAGARGTVPASSVPDMLVEVFGRYEAGEFSAARGAMARYNRYANFRVDHAMPFSRIDKEILKMRGVIRSTYARGPTKAATARDLRDLRILLKDLGLIG